MSYVIVVILILSAVFHQSLYFLVPSLTISLLYLKKDFKIELNSFISLFLWLLGFVILSFFIQSIIDFNIKYESLKGILRVFIYLCFVIIGLKLDKKSIKQFILLSIILTIVLFPFTFKNIDKSLGYMGMFQHSNHLAYTTVITMYFLYKHVKIRNTYKFILLVLGGLIVLYSRTSGAIIIMALLILLQLLFSKKIKLAYKLLFLLGPFIIIVTILYSFSHKIMYQFNTLNSLTWDYIDYRIETGTSGGRGSLVWRITYWLQILNEFNNENLLIQLTGKGIGSLTKGHFPYKVIYKDPHNDFLKITIEYGYIGLTVFIGFLFKLYSIFKYNINLIAITLIPLFFDNMLVNFSIMLTLILLITYEYRCIKQD